MATESTERHREKLKMEIDKTISKWFRETADKMNAVSKPNEPAYDLCSNVLPLSHNYCDAVMLLLNDGKKLPAMALIRVMAELTLRFIWCLYPNKQGEDVNTRIRRWLKESYIKAKQNLEKILPSADRGKREEIEAAIKRLNDDIAQIPYHSAGPLYNSLEDLAASNCGDWDWENDIYPLLYTFFNQAIHPDLLVLSKLVKQNGDKRVYLADYDAMDIPELKICCMNCAFNIVAATRVVYEWDYQGIKKEYLDIKKYFKRE